MAFYNQYSKVQAFHDTLFTEIFVKSKSFIFGHPSNTPFDINFF